MRSHPHIATTAAVVLALAVTAPAADATTTATSPVIRPNPDEQVLTVTHRTAEPRPAPRLPVRANPDEQTPNENTLPTTIVRVAAPSHGFHWGDAGIGAAGALGLAALAIGAALTNSQRRARRTSRSAATTS